MSTIISIIIGVLVTLSIMIPVYKKNKSLKGLIKFTNFASIWLVICFILIIVIGIGVYLL